MKGLFVALLLAQIVGGEFNYTVVPGESLTRIGARFGVDIAVIAEMNRLSRSAWLQAGQVLKIDNRHIVPGRENPAIVINAPQRMLFFFEQNQVSRSYPLAA